MPVAEAPTIDDFAPVGPAVLAARTRPWYAQTAAGIAFGGGIHTCLGYALARIEIQEALLALTERFEPAEVTGPVRFRPSLGIFGPTTLPVRLRPRRG